MTDHHHQLLSWFQALLSLALIIALDSTSVFNLTLVSIKFILKPSHSNVHQIMPHSSSETSNVILFLSEQKWNLIMVLCLDIIYYTSFATQSASLHCFLSLPGTHSILELCTCVLSTWNVLPSDISMTYYLCSWKSLLTYHFSQLLPRPYSLQL